MRTAARISVRAAGNRVERRESATINRRFTQMGTECNALSAWRKATKLVTSNEY